MRDHHFTGYQIFVTREILVFHRCLYNKSYLEVALHFAAQNSRVTLLYDDGLFSFSAPRHFLFSTANPLGSVIIKSPTFSWN